MVHTTLKFGCFLISQGSFQGFNRFGAARRARCGRSAVTSSPW